MVSVIPKSLGRTVWPLMVMALVSLAVYVSGGRLLLGALPGVKQDIAQLLSERFSGDIRIGQISGAMEGFSPRLDLTDFVVLDSQTGAAISLPEASIRLNPWESLLSGAPRFDELMLIGPRVEWSGESGTDSIAIPAGLRDFLSSFARLQVRDAHLIGEIDRDGVPMTLESLTVDIDLARDRSRRILRVSIDSPDGRLVSAEGSGTGNPFELNQFSGELQGSLSGAGMSYLAQWLQWDLTAEGQADFWFAVTGGKPTAVMQVNLTQIAVTGQTSINLDQLRVDSVVEGPFDQARIWIDDASLAADDQTFLLPRIHLHRLGRGWKMLSNRFEVSPLIAVLRGSKLLPDKANEILETLSPAGSVDRLALTLETLDEPLHRWELAATVTDATTDPFKKVPGLVGIDASITANEKGATAWIDTQDFELVLPNVYREPIRLTSVLGALEGRWQRDALFLEHGLLLGSAPEHDAAVQFEIDIPFSKKSSVPLEMRLAASVLDAPVGIRDAYVPYRMPAPAYSWLQQALPDGQIERGIFLWHGGFKPYGHPGQTMQLAADLSGVTLDYQPGWPVALLTESQLRLDDTRIHAWSAQGQMAGLSLVDTTVGLQVGSDAIWLDLQTQSKGKPGEILSSLEQLPALAMAYPVMRDLTVGGDEPTETSAHIRFDVRNVGPSLDVDVDVALTNATLASTLLDLQAASLSGDLRYRTQTGFESTGITARVFDRQVAVAMGPQFAASPDTLLAAQLDFEVAVSDILSWRGINYPLPAEGVTAVTVGINVASDVAVDIESDLKGVSVDLPLPWGKSAGARAPLKVSWRDREWAAWEVFWFGRASAITDTPKAGSVSAILDVTPRTRPLQWPLLAPDPGLRVTGFLPSLDPSDWQDTLAPVSAEVGPSGLPVTIDALKIGRLLWRGEELGALSLNANLEGETLYAGFELPWLRGQLQQFTSAPVSDSAAALQTSLERELRIEYLDLQGLPKVSEQWAERAAPPDPQGALGAWMRQLHLSVEGIHRADTELGDLDLTIDYVEDEGWQFREVTGNFLGINWLPKTRIIWQSSEEGESTTLSLAAELQDVATSLALVGVAPLVETERGRLDAEWQWPGSPADFELTAMSGDMQLEMEAGSFVTANAEATGALRLLSLLNLSGLFRRANMNQLFDPGVTFDSAGGSFNFSQGDLRIPDFSIEGSGGYFTFSSDIDLVTETLDGELVVTLPLVENIPWVAALAGGLPIAAGTYLVSKVFEDQVNQLSSGVYTVSGDLDNPEVSFERVFDATSRLPEVDDQAAEDQSPTGATASSSER
jgi:uncharacterized protein (TIGR02099 family)